MPHGKAIDGSLAVLLGVNQALRAFVQKHYGSKKLYKTGPVNVPVLFYLEGFGQVSPERGKAA